MLTTQLVCSQKRLIHYVSGAALATTASHMHMNRAEVDTCCAVIFNTQLFIIDDVNRQTAIHTCFYGYCIVYGMDVL